MDLPARRARVGPPVLRSPEADPRAPQPDPQIEERTREAQRLEKILQDAGIKLSSATDILGVSGRAMLTALVEGTRDPEILSELARGQLRKKLPQLKEALAGRFGAHHGLLVGTILSHLDFLDEAIEHLSARSSR